jgi:hypothetical protein
MIPVMKCKVVCAMPSVDVHRDRDDQALLLAAELSRADEDIGMPGRALIA